MRISRFRSTRRARSPAGSSRHAGAGRPLGARREEVAAARFSDLSEQTLGRRLVGTPAQESRSVPKATIGEMVVSDLDDERRLETLPLARSFGRPPTRA